MVRWHHRFSGHELGQTLGDGEGQGSLVCYSPWDHKEWDMIEQLNNKLPNDADALVLEAHFCASVSSWIK